VPRLITADPAEAAAFLERTLAAGHEGVMAKDLAPTYEAGSRGAGWLKIKPAHTLDLVVLAAEWGSGRRRGWLSNLHLGARDPATGGFVMLGKTFKGMTDEMLAWQTERLEQLAVARDRHTVHVRPELVVEIAFDGVQESPSTLAAWRCASPASSATARTSRRRRPTRSRRCGRSGARPRPSPASPARPRAGDRLGAHRRPRRRPDRQLDLVRRRRLRRRLEDDQRRHHVRRRSSTTRAPTRSAA
jgi:ATP-dependent DNA ligase